MSFYTKRAEELNTGDDKKTKLTSNDDSTSITNPPTMTADIPVDLSSNNARSDEKKPSSSGGGSSCCCCCDGCCTRIGRRLRAEITHPAFSPMEMTGEILDGPRTFGPSGHVVLVTKTLLMAFSASILVMGFLPGQDLILESTYWANSLLLLSTIYFALSWYSTALNNLNKCPCMNADNVDDEEMKHPNQKEGSKPVMFKTNKPIKTDTDITFLHKVMWGLYAIVAPAEIVVTAGYWGMDLFDWYYGNNLHIFHFFHHFWNHPYELVVGEGDADNLDDANVQKYHGDGTAYIVLACYYASVYGGMLLLLLVEGLLINRVPLRVRHFGLLILYMIVGLMFTIAKVMYYEIRGDPNQIEYDTYGLFQWDKNPLYVLLVPFFFVLTPPLAFMIVYWFSLPARRYSHALTDDMTVIMSYAEI